VALHAANAMAVAFVLIAVSCGLAAMFQIGDSRLIPVLTANGPLLVFCIAALTGWAHLKPIDAGVDQAVSRYLTRIAVKERDRQSWVDLATVDWIEAQGNYVALHVGDRTHLIRDTLANVERGLDPARFARVHRSAIVAVDRIEAVGRPTNGDATITLAGGKELRLSRSYRAKLRERLNG
jgi:DNA-binding LytR/AlgR family response regulator